MMSPRFLAAAVLLACPARLYADRWVAAEAPAAIAISDAQSGAFRTGVMPAIGVYAGRGVLALGLRLRAGVLRNGPAPSGHLSDPGLGGLGTAGLALRLAVRGLWIEGVAGGGLTGHDLAPAVEAGLGWDFAVGSVDLGPSARWVHVASRDPMSAFGSADLLLVGVDVRFGGGRAHAAAPVAIATSAGRTAPDPIDEARDHGLERDRDHIVEHEVGCATDSDGCQLAEHIFLQDDRIVLDDRVLFDTDRAHVKSRGRELIGELVRIWSEHPEWRRMSIEGHADMRGTDEYNLELSQRRAERVRDVFVRYGVDPVRMDVVGYGRTRPRDPGSSEEAHQHNRRVEFVIAREPAGATP